MSMRNHPDYWSSFPSPEEQQRKQKERDLSFLHAVFCRGEVPHLPECAAALEIALRYIADKQVRDHLAGVHGRAMLEVTDMLMKSDRHGLVRETLKRDGHPV